MNDTTALVRTLVGALFISLSPLQAQDAATSSPDPAAPAPETTPAAPADPAAAAPVDQVMPAPTSDPAAPEVNLAPNVPPGEVAAPGPKIDRSKIPSELPTKKQVAQRARELERDISPKRISLLDAVRVTLLQDTQIELRKEDVQIAEGTLKTAMGQFDTRALASVGYDRSRQELQRSSVDPQIDQRNRNRATIVAVQQEREGQLRNLATLQEGLLPDPDQEDTAQESLRTEFDRLVQQIVGNIASPEQLAELNRIEERQIQQGIETVNQVLDSLDSTEANARQQLEKFPVNRVIDQELVTYELALLRQFRNGISVSPFINYNRVQDNFSFRGGQEPIARSEVGLEINIPLLKGSGVTATAARERAAIFDFEASRMVMQHTASASVLRTVLAYWNVVAAQEQLALLVHSELISTALVRLTNVLIEADELPRAEAAQTIAREQSVASARIAAELRLISARQTLALAMGLDEKDMAIAPIASDNFPSPISVAKLKPLEQQLVSEAMNLRLDRRASLKLEQSGKVLLDAARRNLLPRLDVTMRGSYSGLHEDSDGESYYAPYLRNTAGPSVFVGVSLDWPFANDLEEGRFLQSQALHHQSIIRTTELSRSIASNVYLTSRILQKSLEQLRRAEAASTQFQKAFESEQEKFKFGNSTIIDATLTEERLTTARLDVVTAKLQHAQAIAQLRFETGTLMSPDGAPELTTIRRSDLVTLPPIQGFRGAVSTKK